MADADAAEQALDNLAAELAAQNEKVNALLAGGDDSSSEEERTPTPPASPTPPPPKVKTPTPTPPPPRRERTPTPTPPPPLTPPVYDPQPVLLHRLEALEKEMEKLKDLMNQLRSEMANRRKAGKPKCAFRDLMKAAPMLAVLLNMQCN